MNNRIRRLDEEVVNRIAAGEIIVSPANALKEILENAIDAGSTSIDVSVKDGGLKFLQVTDNGTGIVKDDLPLLCERYTTSKLQKFEDLTSISTYGFRGEALASISYVARLTVTTKTEDSTTAWRTTYSNGQIAPNGGPKPVAGKTGTQITVEDLFYNSPARIRAIGSKKNVEFGKILEIVSRYAIRSTGTSFTCKRLGDSHPSLAIQRSLSIVERIRTVFGSEIAGELLHVDIEREDPLQRADVYVTNANFSSKKAITPVIFINSRLVEFGPLRRALSNVYASLLPKGRYPFIYVDLQIDPSNVDVNVHPTKREVRFLHEEEVVDLISARVQSALSEVDSSRNFQTQTLLPTPIRLESFMSSPASPSTPTQKRPYEYKLVRTDAKQQKLTTLFKMHDSQVDQPAGSQLDSQQSLPEEGVEEEGEEDPSQRPQASQATQKEGRQYRRVGLESITQLRHNVEAQASNALTVVLSRHTFVGIADYSKRLAAIQHDVRLYLIDYGALLKELFYQICLSDFANFGRINLNSQGDESSTLPGVPLRRLLEVAMEMSGDDTNSVDRGLQTLVDYAEMLDDYFNISLVEGEEGDKELYLTSLPLLVKGYNPSLSKLPEFVFRLTKRICDDELECLQGISEELALLYIPPMVANEEDESGSDSEAEQMREQVRTDVGDILLPLVSQRIIAPKHLKDGVIEIANLPGLYRVFERC